jgi:hypothetical protein
MSPKASSAEAFALGRTGDGSPSVLSVAQEGARKGGREAELQVGFGAEFGEIPFGELAAQKQAETLAEHQAAAAASEVGAGAASQVEQIELALRAAAKRSTASSRRAPEVLALIGDAAGEVAGAVPGLKSEARSPRRSSAKFSASEGKAVPRRVRAGRVGLELLRKASISARVSSALRPESRWTGGMETAL